MIGILCTCPEGELRLDCPVHYKQAFELLWEKNPVWAAYITVKMRLYDLSLYQAIAFVRDQNHFEG